MDFQTVRDVDWQGKRALVRVDFNVPLDKASGAITDDTRLRAALPTIKYLREHGARVVLMSHLGRPDGKVVERLRMAPVAERLSELLGVPVPSLPECVGPRVEEAVRALKPGEVVLLQNLRFHPEEEANDPEFARQLAALGDVFVNDAFGTAHRAHASTAGVATYLPAVAGLLMEKELAALGGVLERPQRPFVALIGGAKVSTKLGVLEQLLGRVDALLIGGGMACTLLKARGFEVGRSLLEADRLGEASDLLRRAHERGVRLLLPVDAVVTDRLEAGATSRVVPIELVPADMIIADIGPATVQRFTAELGRARTVLWNGPMGVFEIPPFDAGTRAIARFLAGAAARTVVGGGETVAAVEQTGQADRFFHISTGGGAALEFLEGRELPGVAVLKKR